MPVRFSGVLDGNGHSIRNLCVTSFDPEKARTVDGNGYKYKTNVMAFISVAENATVRNLSLVDATVRGESEDHAFVALLTAVSTHSTFENVHVSGSACLYCGAKMAGFIVGARCPIVMVSRGSSAEEKYLSIAVATAVAAQEKKA